MKKLIIQAFKFFGISGIGWIIDMIIFSILSSFNIYAMVCNMISSLVSITFVYFTSTKKLFANNDKSLNLRKKYLLYIIYQVCIILLSSYIISLLAKHLMTVDIKVVIDYAKILAKILVTPFTMVTNFIFMKLLIEKL